MSFKPTDEQIIIADWVRNGSGNGAINAGAGTGKTSTFKYLARDIIGPEKTIKFMAFNRAIKDVLVKFIKDELTPRGHSWKTGAQTFNGAGYKAMMDRFKLQSQQLMNLRDEKKYDKLASAWVEKHMSRLDDEQREMAVDLIAKTCHFFRVNTTTPVSGSKALVVLTGYNENGAVYEPHNPNDMELMFSVARRYSLLGNMDNELDELRALEAIPEIIRLGRDMLYDADDHTWTFTDQVYYTVVDGWRVWGSDFILVDEAQDLSPLFRALVDKHIFNSRVLIVGDPCQPSGTLVSMPDKTQKRIEDLKIGDYVVSYNESDNAFLQKGRRVNGITKRPYAGNLIVVETSDGLRSEYTPNHHCYANFSPLRKKFAVYMMRKGNQFRIGMTAMDFKNERLGCGVVRRMRDEAADAAWVLGAYDTREEAFVMEESISGKFGITQLRFTDGANSNVMNQDRLKLAWEWIGDNSDRAYSCLRYFNRDPKYPLVTNEYGKYISLKRPMVVHACNLMDGVEVLPYQGYAHNKKSSRNSDWRAISVSYKSYVGYVYSLDVDKDHLYIADKIVTHNCQAIYAFTGADNHGFESACKYWGVENEMTLSISWRSPQKVAEIARSWKPNFKAAPTAIEGVVEDILIEDAIKRAEAGWAFISRVRAPMIPLWHKFISAGKPAVIVGSDVSKSILATIEIAERQKGFKFDELMERIVQYRDRKVAKMRAKRKGDDEIDSFIDQMSSVISAIEAVDARDMFELKEKIKAIFAKDDTDGDSLQSKIAIMTGHASKGLEFPHVVILTPNLFPFNHPRSTVESHTQEMNLKYVAETRAMVGLYYVRDKVEKPETKAETPVISEPTTEAIADVIALPVVTEHPSYYDELCRMLDIVQGIDLEHASRLQMFGALVAVRKIAYEIKAKVDLS